MMGFITRIDFDRKCDVCKQSFTATASGNSHPYDDYSCDQCSWSGLICQTCAGKKCPQCSGQIRSTSDHAPKGLMY